MIFTPPVPIPVGQAIKWLLPTTAEARSADLGASNGSAVANLGADGNPDGSGLVVMTGSAPLANWIWAIQWADFPALSLPLNGVVAAIYGVARVSKVGANAFREASVGTSVTPWNVGMGGSDVVPNSVGIIDPAAEFASATLGTDPSIIPSLKFGARLFSTASIPSFDDIFSIEGVALAVYYRAPILPIGHGANCNDYDPVTLEDGSTTPPGNGLLIS